jgi:hypothetical protein
MNTSTSHIDSVWRIQGRRLTYVFLQACPGWHSPPLWGLYGRLETD